MPNLLTTRATLNTGPLFFGTLVKHYFARVVSDGSNTGVPLRREELLYDEAFNIVKSFLNVATRHTVEELQSFANIRTPSPPSVHVVRLVVPMTSCDEAASYLIKAFGGEDVMKRVVGGTKWWQVRGVRGLDAEWITTKKDYQNVHERAKGYGGPLATPQEHTGERPEISDPTLNGLSLDLAGGAGASSTITETPRDSATYHPEMDAMRCILYSHGGGYYFGSVDQERFCIQRYARKIHGRVLAVNYRLAPQYPFPCAIQDLLAAYIFLIRPPEGAAHRPISPERIVIAGDSAGGGLSLAVLQVIRDSGLPAPAGGVLISPWCDLTHSFPSIHTNTDTDVIPSTGLSLHKPSPLWPPPSNDIRSSVRTGKSVVEALSDQTYLIDQEKVISSSLPESTTSPPLPKVLDANQSFVLQAENGEVIEVAQQVQLYAPNGLLKHPLISPVLSYLGGLPPLFFIAGDKEVLRDEIIYTAHRAAHPDRFPVRDETKDMYPTFKHDMRPTPVHLQVYDDVAHILPILFPFTTPGKYCHRAMALFSMHVIDVPDHNTSLLNEILTPPVVSPKVHTSRFQRAASSVTQRRWWLRPSPQGTSEPRMHSGNDVRVTPNSQDPSGDVVGRSAGGNPGTHVEDVPKAGEASVYAGNWAKSTADHQTMIRERVSTQGIIRPLEPESELPAMQVPPERIGTPSEYAMRRFIVGHARFEKKFARALRRITKNRQRQRPQQHDDDDDRAGWDISVDEYPPRGSIVARRDTKEALRLAHVADKAVHTSESAFSANHLWNVVVGFLTTSSAERRANTHDGVGARSSGFVSFFRRTRRSGGSAGGDAVVTELR